MEITVTRKAHRVKATLSGELDHHTAKEAREALDNLIGDETVMELVLDMSGVTFMDSSGLGVVLGRYRILCERGGRLLLSSTPPQIDRIFQMAGIYKVVDRA